MAARVGSLIENGQMIEAVKEVRSATGMGLREAKQLVERVAAGQPLNDLSASHPQQAGSDPSARVFAVVALAISLFHFVAIWLLAS